ncbi:MAG: terminase small subunit [Gammaproteobacteria bacterium]
MIVTKKKLADILGKTERALTEWQQAGMPIAHQGARGHENKYDTAKVIRWLMARESDNYLDAARTRLANEQALRIEMENKLRSGELLDVTTISKQLKNTFFAIRQRILAWPNRVSPMITGKPLTQVGIILSREVRDLLTELANFSIATPAVRPKRGAKTK